MAQGSASIGHPLIRGFAYALTSLLAHGAGYLLAAQPRQWIDTPLVLALWATTLPFFLAYSIAFSRDGVLGEEPDDAPRWAKENSWPVVIGGSILVATVFLLLFNVLSDAWPELDYWIALSCFAILFLRYGHFTLQTARAAIAVPIRHQLVWPVAFSIALPLYSGAVFGPSRGALSLLWPPLVLVAYFLLSSGFSKRSFVLASIGLVGTAILLTAFSNHQHLQQFPLMIFFLAIAAYLAVFESWAATSALAAQGKPPARYYLATLAAQLLSALSLPFLFVFSDQGYLFAAGLLAHSLISTMVWFWVGDDLSRLRSPRWLVWKTAVGFLFLVLLVIDSWWPRVPQPQRLIPQLVVIGIPAFLLAVASAALAGKGVFVSRQFSLAWLIATPWNRQNLAALASGIAILMMGATVILEGFLGTTDVSSLAKADFAFMSYLIAFLVCLLAALFWKAAPPRAGGIAVGVLLSMRLFTSTMVAVVVLLPHLHTGAPLVPAFLFEALPFALAAAGGFLLNDAHDWKRDGIDKPYRAVPRGLLTPGSAASAGYAFLLSALLLAFADGLKTETWALQLGAVVGVAAYNRLVDSHSWAKGLVAATISILPVSAALLAGDHLPGPAWILVSAFCFLLSRELLMDVLDYHGDSETSRRTLAVLLGEHRTEQLAAALLVLAGAALGVSNLLHHSLVRGALGVTALAMLLVLARAWRGSGTLERRRRMIRLSWAPMLVALLSML